MPRRSELSEFKTEVSKRLDKIDANLEKHMSRTELLEKFQARVVGAFLAVGALGTVATLALRAFDIFGK